MQREPDAPSPDTSTSPEVEILIDARGHRCPVPTLLLRRALARAGPGAAVRLIADDPMARIDVPHFAAQCGYDLVETQMTQSATRFLVRRP